MGDGKRQLEVRAYRGQMPSPGRPSVAWREDRVRFWAAIAAGAMTEDAAVEAGVSSPVGFRWFRHAGGVNPRLPATVSGRYLSSNEREDIAFWRAQGAGVREIARRLGPGAVDDLAGTAPQRLDAHVPARLQGLGRAVACRTAGAASQDGQAGRQRPAARVRPGQAVRGRARRLTGRSWPGRPRRSGRDATSLTGGIGPG